jgi:dihydrofolate reductase
MRRIRYAVSSSLDGYIANTQGEADWIIMDPEIDFQQIFQEFDTLLIGRRTFEAMLRTGQDGIPGMKTIVFSTTLLPKDHPNIEIVATHPSPYLGTLRKQKGKDIWLFGGGDLFRSLLAAGEVDSVEVSVMPILLGGGVPLLPPPSTSAKLKLMEHQVYQSGIVSMKYSVTNPV